jgi:hypothetical protein
MVVALASVLGLVLLFQPDPATVRVENHPAPAAWEIQAWRGAPCERCGCGRGLTPDPGDGLYLIGGKPYWLHKACAQRLARVARQ